MTLALLLPQWPAPPGVSAVFTLRGQSAADGASHGAYASFNLGDHVGDEAVAVASNRRRLQQALVARPVFLQQVHGCAVVTLAADTPDGVTADAAVTSARQLACTVMVADCLPVLLAAADGRVVAAAHAGWRGLAAGILFETVAHMRHQLAADGRADTPIIAWLGPCIGPTAFEVGAEVQAAFVAGTAAASDCFVARDDGKYLADLAALARQSLDACGVAAVYGNDGTTRWCTVRQASRYYSYRRDQRARGASGRMAACIWRA